jgi:ATP-dependent Lhr-like helicase
VVWVGGGSLGRDDGRVVLYRPDRLPLLLADVGSTDTPSDAATGPHDRLHAAIRQHLETRGASFHRELLAAAFTSTAAAGERRPSEREFLDALWDLVWAGEVSNDTFAPLRALRWPRRGGDRRAVSRRPMARMGPPEAVGRWSLLRDTVGSMMALGPGSPPSTTERRAALASMLLERYGVVTRDAVAAEELSGGFGAVYPVLREMEERGRVRRGYLVEGLGGAQFALPGAIDRLRALRREPGMGRRLDATGILLAATDPAQPFGAALPWPRDEARHRASPSRSAGAYVISVDGDLVLYLERGGRSLLTFAPFDDGETAEQALAALGGLTRDGRTRRIQVERIDGVAVASSPHRARLEAHGFRPGYRGLVLGVA